MRLVSLAVAAGIAFFVCGPILAQTPETVPPANPETPQGQQARYSFNRVDGGFLRLDGVSGQVALCSQRSAGWACETVPEERAAFETEIARLQREVTQLKSEVAALRTPVEPPRPPADLAPRPNDAKSGGFKLPTDEDIKWARAAIQNIWRQFVDMVADMQKDLQRKS
jgi:hypothetical protein